MRQQDTLCDVLWMGGIVGGTAEVRRQVDNLSWRGNSSLWAPTNRTICGQPYPVAAPLRVFPWLARVVLGSIGSRPRRSSGPDKVRARKMDIPEGNPRFSGPYRS